ncbi:MAG: substrate-binding periplasmic protein [Arcobacter sp.]|uniref:substrate-binding periplasmic protein n=1 Tax=Arcobacter sp. TaxID=1872629 RepID=UPI003B0089BD
MPVILKSSILILLLTVSLNARSIDDIKKSGEIIIAVYENSPPFSFIENDKPKGIDIDLGLELAKSLNVKAKWYFSGSDESLADDLRNNIWKGNLIHKTKADVMFRVPYDYDYMRMTDISTGELETENVSIKGPYQSESWVIATHKKIIPEINTLAIFAYHKIGVEIDTLPDLHLSGFARGLFRNNIIHYTNFSEAIKDFKAGRIDALSGLKSQLEYLLEYHKNKDKYYLSKSIPQMKSKWDLATATDSRYKALSYHIDGVIQKAYEEKRIKKIFSKYHVEYVPPIARTQ